MSGSPAKTHSGTHPGYVTLGYNMQYISTEMEFLAFTAVCGTPTVGETISDDNPAQNLNYETNKKWLSNSNNNIDHNFNRLKK